MDLLYGLVAMASSSTPESGSLPVSSAVQSVKHKGATRANPDN